MARRSGGPRPLTVAVLAVGLYLILAAVVVVLAWSVRHGGHADGVPCANNLRQMGTVLVASHDGKPWPDKRGAGFLLTLWFDFPLVRGDTKVFICRRDESIPFEPGSPEHRALFETLAPDLETWPDHITSYAARDNVRFPLLADTVEDQVLACDAGPHHEYGVNVLFADGKVERLSWGDLGLRDGRGFRPGPGGPPLLEPLCFRPGAR